MNAINYISNRKQQYETGKQKWIQYVEYLSCSSKTMHGRICTETKKN